MCDFVYKSKDVVKGGLDIPVGQSAVMECIVYVLAAWRVDGADWETSQVGAPNAVLGGHDPIRACHSLTVREWQLVFEHGRVPNPCCLPLLAHSYQVSPSFRAATLAN